MQVGMTISTLQKLGLYQGSLISVSNDSQLATASFCAQICSLTEGGVDETANSNMALSLLPGLSAGSNLWQPDTAYLSPLLATNLGFQPQLLPFLSHSPDQRQFEDAAQSHASPGPRQSGMHQAQPLRAASTANHFDESALVYSSHQRHKLGHRASPFPSSEQMQSAEQHTPGSSQEMQTGREPCRGWLGGHVRLQSLQTLTADLAWGPQHTVCIPQPGDSSASLLYMPQA